MYWTECLFEVWISTTSQFKFNIKSELTPFSFFIVLLWMIHQCTLFHFSATCHTETTFHNLIILSKLSLTLHFFLLNILITQMSHYGRIVFKNLKVIYKFLPMHSWSFIRESKKDICPDLKRGSRLCSLKNTSLKIEGTRPASNIHRKTTIIWEIKGITEEDEKKMKSLRGGKLRLVVEGRKTVMREGMQRRTIEFTSSLQIGFWWQSPLWRTQLMSSDLPETESPESSYSYSEERENQLYFKHISWHWTTVAESSKRKATKNQDSNIKHLFRGECIKNVSTFLDNIGMQLKV